ncbi:COX15/CtaA family protein [Corynebacterium vitaeruminis]|uniref:COX15/CtaA family protein n=1 Tax=Corynebacterium vitaeruminis TaxID=38305 RepID=UPI0005571C43|nr:heme A synthase [Corynebacterium vitaeruminis]
MTTTQSTPSQGVLGRFAPTISTQKKLALALLIGQGAITVTGSIVRVTGSGLGCNTWPNCHEGSLVPVEGAAPWIHQAIEFGNRMLTFVLVALAISVFVAVKSTHRRKEIFYHALFQCLGIVVQAVIGGISVLLDLQWWAVALHFLPSMILVWAAGVLYTRIGEPDDGTRRPAFSGALRSLSVLSAALMFAVLVTGTMTTGAGVHSGDSGVGMDGRLEVDIAWMAHVHAWVMYAYLAFTIILVAGLVFQRAPRRSQSLGWTLIAFIVIQAGVGIMQYRLGVPSWSVPMHVGLCSFVVAFSSLLFATGIERVGKNTWVTGSEAGDAKRAALTAA